MSSERELSWLRRVRDLSLALSVESDPAALIPRILDAAIELTSAERGLLVLIPGRRADGKLHLRVAAARGFGGADLGREIAISQRVVERVLERHDHGALLITSGDDKDLLEASSVSNQHIRSIAGVPLVLRGEVRGVLYLDHREQQDAFDERDLPALQTFACQAALALETAELRGGPNPAHDPENAALACGRLAGRSPAMIAVYGEAERASRSDDSVLILGEPGTGKSELAREIHSSGAAGAEPFVEVDCKSFTGDLLLSELFGHVEGAYPWAKSNRRGAFVLAGKGTLFLRHIEAASPDVQARLVTALRSRSARAQGAPRSRKIACRLIASAGEELAQLVEADQFRPDLYYRLDVQRIVLPPLRQRPGDVVILCDAMAAKQGVSKLRLSRPAVERLAAYPWPGNAHELLAEVKRLLSLAKPELSLRDLSQPIQDGIGLGAGGGAYTGKTLGEVEREMVELALNAAKGNKSHAARQLGIPRSSLYHLMQRYGLQ